MSENKGRKQGLDFLRFLACIGILFLHFNGYLCKGGVYFGDLLIDPSGNNSGINMNAMVEIFFALSGFLIYPYSKRIKERSLCFKNYMLSRMIRILPMLTIGTIVLELLSFLIVNSGNIHELNISFPYLWGVISACLGIEYNGIFVPAEINHESWYLDVLLECYLFFYIAVRISERTKIKDIYIFAAYVFVGAAFVSGEFSFPYNAADIGRGFEAFFTSVIFADILEEKSEKKVLYLSAVIVLAVYTLCLGFCPGVLTFGKIHLISFFVAPSLILLCTSPLADKLFGWKGWRVLGDGCYSAYVLHVSIIFLILKLADEYGLQVDYSHEVVFMTYVIIVFAIGILACHFIEKPVARILKRWLKIG